jgi:hypothetical protein
MSRLVINGPFHTPVYVLEGYKRLDESLVEEYFKLPEGNTYGLKEVCYDFTYRTLCARLGKGYIYFESRLDESNETISTQFIIDGLSAELRQ